METSLLGSELVGKLDTRGKGNRRMTVEGLKVVDSRTARPGIVRDSLMALELDTPKK
jgi:hypothetical protein